MVQHGSTGSKYAGFKQPWKLHACIQWLGGRYGVYGCIHGSFIYIEWGANERFYRKFARPVIFQSTTVNW